MTVKGLPAIPRVRRRAAGWRTDWSEAELLGEGFAGNPATLKALQQRCGLTNAKASAVCGVDPRTYRRWRSEGNPDPAAVRLLAVLAGFVPWPGWDGWEVDRGCFFPPGFNKGGISPGEFHALVFWRQMVTTARRENAALRARVAELETLQDQLTGGTLVQRRDAAC